MALAVVATVGPHDAGRHGYEHAALQEGPNGVLKLSTSFSSDLVKTCPFKIKPSEDLEAKCFISYTPWTKF